MSISDKAATSKAIIGPSLHVEGTITGDESLVIEGRVDGSVIVQNAEVTIGKEGVVRADVQAKKIRVDGEVRGELRGTEVVKVGPSGTVIGDIRSPRVMLQDGCQFKGLVDMDYKEAGGNPIGHVAAERNLAKPPAPKPMGKPTRLSPAPSTSDAPKTDHLGRAGNAGLVMPVPPKR